MTSESRKRAEGAEMHRGDRANRDCTHIAGSTIGACPDCVELACQAAAEVARREALEEAARIALNGHLKTGAYIAQVIRERALAPPLVLKEPATSALQCLHPLDNDEHGSRLCGNSEPCAAHATSKDTER